MARQKELAGMEKPHIKEIDDAAETYFKQAKAYGKAGEKVKVAREALIGALKKHKVETYTDTEHNPPLAVSLKDGKEKLLVRAVDASGNEVDETDETDKAAA